MAGSDPPRLQSLLDWFVGIMSLWPSVPAKLGKSKRLSMDKTSAGIFENLSAPLCSIARLHNCLVGYDKGC